jgi:hypothetical protein
VRLPSVFPRCACLLLSLAGAGLCQGGAGKYIELTAADLFAAHNWNSRQVSVLGFHLGMAWPDVSAQARARGLNLVGQGDPRRQTACEGKGWCKELRLKLLGPEDTQTSTDARSIVFTYRQRGVGVQVSPCPEGPPESPCAVLDVEFVTPGPAK